MHELTYTQPQTWIGLLFLLIVVLLVTAFVAIGRSSRRDVPYEEVARVGYGIRTWWFIGFATVLTFGVVTSFFFLPYSGARGVSGKAQPVAVKGGQYYWTVSPQAVKPGHVRLRVTSADVNHGLGIYSPRGEMVGSVQAMPGYTNTLDLQLTEAGEYQLSCLELCGTGHHKMHSTLTVSER